MDANELEQKLKCEGFARTYVWHDRPGAFYSDHTHATETAHIILSGEMELTMNGRRRDLSRGRPL
jgi:hypothetical protein